MKHHHDHGDILSFVPIFLIMVVMLLYLLGVWRLKRNSRSWSFKRTWSMLGGSVLLVMGLLPHVHNMALQDFYWHMVQHLLIGMLAPAILVFSAPVTLLLRNLPKNRSKIIISILHSSPLMFLAHPYVTLILNMGGMFLLYFTPLYLLSLENTFIHALVHLHFLFAGYLFTWSLVGIDPSPKKIEFNKKLLVLFVAIAAHASMSKYMYAYSFPVGTPYSSEQLKEAAKFMYYGGDAVELLILVVLFLQARGGRTIARPGDLLEPSQ